MTDNMHEVAPATLTIREAAKVLGVGRALAYEMARAGRIPVIRLGRRLVVPRPALERMLDTWRPDGNDR